MVSDDWQRRCDESLIASINRRESETKPPPPLAVIFVVASLVWVVAIGVSVAYGHLGLVYAVPAVAILLAGAAYIGRPRARFA